MHADQKGCTQMAWSARATGGFGRANGKSLQHAMICTVSNAGGLVAGVSSAPNRDSGAGRGPAPLRALCEGAVVGYGPGPLPLTPSHKGRGNSGGVGQGGYVMMGQPFLSIGMGRPSGMAAGSASGRRVT